MTVAREEIFGPVLCIIGYKDADDAVAIANDSVYGLAAYVQLWEPLRSEPLKTEADTLELVREKP